MTKATNKVPSQLKTDRKLTKHMSGVIRRQFVKFPIFRKLLIEVNHPFVKGPL